MKKLLGVAVIAAFAVCALSATIYAAGMTSGWFRADETGTLSNDYTELTQHKLDFTTGVDDIAFHAENDKIDFGSGNDMIHFWGDSTSTENIFFGSDGQSYMRWTGQTGDIAINANTGALWLHTYKVDLGDGDDIFCLGPGSDQISFWGGAGSTENIYFDSGHSSYIRWEGQNDNVTIKSHTGDVVIQLGS